MERRDFFKIVGLPSLAASTLPAGLLARGVPVERREVEPEPGDQDLSELYELFERHLELCEVREGETLLYYSTPGYEHPEYVDATLAAARALGARAYSLVAPSQTEESDLLLESFKAADIVYGAIPLYTDAHNAALASGTRTLMLSQDLETLRRMFPDPAVIERTYAGARRLAEAELMRVTDEAGSDFTLRKTARKGHAQVGISADPGRWDHWPSGLVACAPHEDGVDGTYVVQPGDVLLGLGLRCEDEIRMTLEGGRITKIEGGYDAAMIRERLALFEDAEAPEGRLSDPYRISHAGWGTEHRAQWHVMGMDSESMYGNVMVSLGRNMFDSADEFSGLGGRNYTPVHIDICCRNKRLFLDGDLIVDDDAVVPSALA